MQQMLMMLQMCFMFLTYILMIFGGLELLRQMTLEKLLILMQFFMGAFSLGMGSLQGGVAWWAHIGGFAVGAILIFVFRKRKRHLPREFADQYYPW